MANTSGPTATLLVAEDIRLEANGKMSLLGFFADNVIIADAAGRSVSEEEPITLRLALLVVLTKFPPKPKQFNSVVELVNVKGEAERLAEQVIDNPGLGRSANLIFNFLGINFAAPGVRKLRVHLDDEVMDLPFEVLIANATPERQPVAAKQPKQPPKSSKGAAVKPRASKKG